MIADLELQEMNFQNETCPSEPLKLRKESLAGAVVPGAMEGWVIREQVFPGERGGERWGTGRDADSDPDKPGPQVGTYVTWRWLRLSESSTYVARCSSQQADGGRWAEHTGTQCHLEKRICWEDRGEKL